MIFPPCTIGCTWPSTPEDRVTSGSLLKLIISDEPYPTPLSAKWIDVTSPLNIGWILASKVSFPTDVTPTSPVKVTLIGG